MVTALRVHRRRRRPGVVEASTKRKKGGKLEGVRAAGRKEESWASMEGMWEKKAEREEGEEGMGGR